MTRLTSIAGIIGLGAACGPTPPQTSDDGTGADTSTSSEIVTTGEPPVTTGEPTLTIGPTTTTPPPECVENDDCYHLYCGYCDGDGTCREGAGCCGLRGDGKGWRCSPPYECYGDEDCGDGYACEGGLCVPITMPKLQPCKPVEVLAMDWNLEATPDAFALIDLDLDGDLDLAATQPAIAQVELQFNDGAGNFSFVAGVPVGGPTPMLALAAGDLDDDADIDLAVVRNDPDGGLILIFGDGLMFTAEPPLPTAPAPAAVFVRTLGDDALEDILTIDAVAARGRLGAVPPDFSQEFVAVNDVIDPRASLFDFNLDGRLDLFSILGATAAGAWMGQADGGFTPNFSVDIMVPLTAALVDDLNLLPLPPEDDLPSLVLTRAAADTGGQIDVLAANNTPQLFEPAVSFFTSRPIAGGALAEIEAPPGPDLLAATGGPSVLVVPGDGAGGFACEREIPVPGATVQPLLAAGDVDGNGLVDLVIGEPNTSGFTVLLTQ